MNKRILALLLLAVMAISVIACAADPAGNPQNDTTAPSDTAAPSETTVPEETEATPDLPDVGDKYKDTEFVILHRGMEVSSYKEPWVFAEGVTGDTINDAVYKRNSAVEEKYGVTFKEVINSKPHEALSLASAASDDDYDIAYPLIQYIRPYLLQGICYNLNDVEYLGFDKPWWDSYLVEEFDYKGKLFVASSDANLSVATRCRGMYFNRDLAKEYNLDDPYQLVKDNKWTLDKVAEMVQGVSNDVNGNSEHDDGDVYGMLTEMGGTNGNVYNFVISSGTTMFERSQADDSISIGFMNEKTMSILEKCRSFLLDTSITRKYGELTKPGDFTGNNYQYGRSLFASGHFLFFQGGPRTIEELVANNMEAEYGIVPNPKYESAQERYYNHTDPNAAVYCIPSTNDPDDLERIAIISEYLSYVSSQKVLPEYYETIIALRRARVPELGEMVDLMKNSVYYDITTLYGLSHSSIIDDAFNSGDFGSVFAAQRAALETNIEKLGEQLSVLD